MTTEPDKFCKAPFRGLVVDNDGTLMPCCEFMKDDSSLPQYKIWEYEKYKADTTLRQKMINGEPDGGCSYCIKRESTGINRRKYHSRLFKENYEAFKADTLNIGHLELRLGNFCNLKCTMCGPYASSQWSAEAKKNQEKFAPFNIGYLKTDHDWINDENNKKLMKEILQNCVSANFGGGEPFMNPFIDDFLKEIKLDAELSFNTNGTKLLDSTLALLENRPNLIINISLDGIGEHNNYIRSGSKWQDIENNVKRFKQKNIKILFYYILQHTSLFTFQPVYEYCVKNNIELGIGEIYSGSVDGSGHLTLNSASKNDVDSFKKWLSTINSPKVIVVDNWLKNYKFDNKLHDRFKQYFTMLDSVRGTDFNKTFNPSWT
jgi:sulfatase maturation enzyme AslB (radical SAM superfamily)